MIEILRSGMRTTYVLDTSVLIFDPACWKQFTHSDVCIPIVVLNELDNLKKLPNEAGKNARVVIRLLDEISNRGDISTGILLEDDILLKVDAAYIDLAQPQYQGLGNPTYGDTQILAYTQLAWHSHPEHDVVLVSNDINLRIKAKARGIETETCEGKKYSLGDLYSGVQVIVDEEAGLELQRKGHIDPKNYNLQLMPHECVLFEAINGDGIAMGRLVSPDKIKLVRKVYPWGISCRNKEQIYAADLIMDKNVDLVTLIGRAGTGKSLIALGTALELVLNKREYERLIIYRPIEVVGKDIGYLPGLLEEKLAPWFQAIMDNLEILFTSKAGGDWRRELEMYQRKGRIELEGLMYIRGRSIPNAIIMVDECQNISKQDMKTILTRAGEGTKIILNGDIDQIDHKDLDAMNNGLIYVVEKFKTSDISGHVTFTRGERSRLATIASEIL